MAGLPALVGAQHEHHGAPTGSAQVMLTGTASSVEGTLLSGAIVRLFHGSGPGRHLMAASVTDTIGRFVVRTGSGSYELEITYAGHESHRQQVILATTPVHVGTVRLEPRRMELNAVTVSAAPDAVVLRSGSTVVNARASAASGGSITDLLRTVPGVELSTDGRISMRGSTSVLVLMNGRRIPLTGDALVAFLDQMPAAALQRIEAGTTASARQGAEGTAGVINLVFSDQSVERTGMRSLAVSMATDQYMGSAAAAGDAGAAVNWDVMYSLSGMRPRTDATTARWSLVPGDLPLETDQDSRMREKHQLHSALAGVGIHPTATTTLALRGTYSWMEGASRDSSAFLYTNSAGNTGTSRTGTVMEHEIPSGEFSAVVSMDLKAVRLNSEARASFVDEDFRASYYDGVAGYRYMTAAMASRQRERVLRNDVALRVAGLTLDLGQESRFHTIDAAHDATHFDAAASQAYRHDLDVHAGYFTANRFIGSVRAEAGLRVELERTRITLDSVIARTNARMFPGISGEWVDARRQLMYRVAYGRRINRPESKMLNPFSMRADDMDEIVGNPSLRPEVADQVELGIERHRPRLTLQLTPFLRWTRDPIREIRAATPRGGVTTTLENLTRARATGADWTVRARPTDGAVVTLTGSVAHMKTTGELFSSSGMYVTSRLTLDLQVAARTTAQFYAHRRSALAIEQGEILPAFASDLALTHRLARDRARVTMRLSDPFGSDRLGYRIADASFTQESRRRTARPLLSVFASYAVGGAPREDVPARREGPARIF
jgi:outer membrane receptor protein involved in Fe transport